MALRLKSLLLLALGITFVATLAAPAKPAFHETEITGPSDNIFFCDLDGDGLDDAILVDKLKLSIFYQDPKLGFPRQPDLQCPLEERPSVLWPAKLGGKSASLLVITSDGVAQLHFTGRTNQPTLEKIITRHTVVPDSMEKPRTENFLLSANNGTEWPLLILPVAEGLEIWQHTDTWRPVQLFDGALTADVTPSLDNPGFTRSFKLSVCLDDIHHDGRDDLMFRRISTGQTQVFELHLHNTNGLFDPEPALLYTNTSDWRTTLAWMDVHHDGKLDLIKSTASDEPSFVPGLQSGKVLVALYLADATGHIPDAPQQIFRKSDWSPFLPLVDIDGDGYMDMVLGSIPIDSRDGIRGIVTAGLFPLNLNFHYFRPAQGYPTEPDSQRNLKISFGHDLIWSLDERLYYEKFVSLNGDFNGDGKKDLLVRDHSDEISVYFFNSRETGFSARPDLQFHCADEVAWWETRDLNGDGISDLVVKIRDANVYRVFLSPGK